MKNYKDCQLKGQILRCISNDLTTSRAIYAEIQHPSYSAFLSELYSLRRKGYITTLTCKKPYSYQLTKLGRLHTADPYLSIRRRRESIQRKVDAILNDNERFQAAVQTEVQNRLPGISPPFSSFPSSQSENPHAANAHLLEELKNKDGEIARLQHRLLELTRAQTSIRQAPQIKPQTPEEQKQEQERVQRRQKLAQVYASRCHPLDFNFFKFWGDMWPYKMKHLQLYKTGSVEILGMSNPEHGRGHTRGMLDEGGIIGAGFLIRQIRKDGIVVFGKGMSEDKLLRW